MANKQKVTTVKTSSKSYFPGDECHGSMMERLPGRDNCGPSEAAVDKPKDRGYKDEQP